MVIYLQMLKDFHLQAKRFAGSWNDICISISQYSFLPINIHSVFQIAEICENRVWKVTKLLFIKFTLALLSKPKLFSSELHKCNFLSIHKQIHSKVPTLLYFVRSKRPSGNCYVSFFLTDKTFLHSVKIQIMGGKVQLR